MAPKADQKLLEHHPLRTPAHSPPPGAGEYRPSYEELTHESHYLEDRPIGCAGRQRTGVRTVRQELAGRKHHLCPPKTQPCATDACANKYEIFLTLPVGAKYVATHYYTTADNPNDRADVYETGPQELSGGRFSEATHAPNQEQAEVVTAYYYNRANRDPKIAIAVDYR